MSNPEDKRMLEGEEILSVDKLDEILGVEAQKALDAAGGPQFKPKVAVPKAEVKATPAAVIEDQIQTEDIDANLQLRIEQLESAIQELKHGKGGVKVVTASKKIVDFTNISEKDVFDMSVPIEAIVHELPDSSLIHLKDKNYIGRWVSKHPIIMGKRKAAGFTFVVKEDLEGDLGMSLELDENGLWSYIDVVAMKCPKAKYFGALRTNQIRAMTVVNPKKAHEIGKAVAQQEMERGFDPDDPGKRSYGKDFKTAVRDNKMEIYI